MWPHATSGAKWRKVARRKAGICADKTQEKGCFSATEVQKLLLYWFKSTHTDAGAGKQKEKEREEEEEEREEEEAASTQEEEEHVFYAC